MFIPGLPTGVSRRSQSWRATVASQAGSFPVGTAHLLVEFTLPPGRWVDLDTILMTTVAGLRDAGVYRRGLSRLESVVATKAVGAEVGVWLGPAATLGASEPPGPLLLRVEAPRPPAPELSAKRAWRARVQAAWGERPPLGGSVWAAVTLTGQGSLLGRLEVVLDALEPVLGRDLRGRDWQEFFPADDRIDWLRVRRSEQGPGLLLQLGPVEV
ncbi:MAG: hypothetical protein ACR2MA_06220 [Egibacteraceae bacterium]